MCELAEIRWAQLILGAIVISGDLVWHTSDEGDDQADRCDYESSKEKLPESIDRRPLGGEI